MASYPEVQKKAQAELDAVVGQHRLPEISDRDSLPYLSALTKECLRWRSVVPLAFPHRSVEDDVFRGYFIPKGTLVIANTWYVPVDTEHACYQYSADHVDTAGRTPGTPTSTRIPSRSSPNGS